MKFRTLLASLLSLFASTSPSISVAQLQGLPDSPIPFAFKIEWFAIRTTNTESVRSFFSLTNSLNSGWEEGLKLINASWRNQDGPVLFISPPIEGWTLVISSGQVFPWNVQTSNRLVEELELLSNEFGEAQYFGSYRAVSARAWFRAVNGNVERGFAEVEGFVVNIGQTTSTETDFGFPDISGLDALEVDQLIVKSDHEGMTFFFDEESPALISGEWSVNPRSLGSLGLPVSVGTVGQYYYP